MADVNNIPIQSPWSVTFRADGGGVPKDGDIKVGNNIVYVWRDGRYCVIDPNLVTSPFEDVGPSGEVVSVRLDHDPPTMLVRENPPPSQVRMTQHSTGPNWTAPARWPLSADQWTHQYVNTPQSGRSASSDRPSSRDLVPDPEETVSVLLFNDELSIVTNREGFLIYTDNGVRDIDMLRAYRGFCRSGRMKRREVQEYRDAQAAEARRSSNMATPGALALYVLMRAGLLSGDEVRRMLGLSTTAPDPRPTDTRDQLRQMGVDEQTIRELMGLSDYSRLQRPEPAAPQMDEQTIREMISLSDYSRSRRAEPAVPPPPPPAKPLPVWPETPRKKRMIG